MNKEYKLKESIILKQKLEHIVNNLLTENIEYLNHKPEIINNIDLIVNYVNIIMTDKILEDKVIENNFLDLCYAIAEIPYVFIEVTSADELSFVILSLVMNHLVKNENHYKEYERFEICYNINYTLNILKILMVDAFGVEYEYIKPINRIQ
jgi:hypothetical protein